MLRGLARESRHWGTFLSCIKERPVIHPLPLDIYGTGIFNKYLSPIRITDYLTPLRKQFLGSTDKNNTHIILGISFGAMIAAHWVERFPSDFEGSIFINTSGRQSPLHHRLKASAFFRLLKIMLHKETGKKEEAIVSLLCNLADKERIVAEWSNISASKPVRPVNQLRQLLCAAWFSFPEKLTIPALILTSQCDRMVDPSCSKTIGTLLDENLITHPTAGHDLTTDDPQWCVEQIFSWLTKVFYSVTLLPLVAPGIVW